MNTDARSTTGFDPLSVALADRYRIERELGQGGMATVYLAQDLKHKRKVAIKVLLPELGVAVGADRFLREIETTANLRHPHILPLYDSGSAGEFLYYVMPLVEGESLRDRLDREKQLPIADALRIAHEVADALSYAHADLLLTDGRPAEAMRELLRAKELDPLAPINMANIGNWYWMQQASGDSALIWMNRALALDPNNPLALENSSSIYFSRGDSTHFFKTRERLDVSSSRAGAPVAELRRAWASGGRNAVLRAQLASPRSQGLSVERARWRAQLGDIDGAFRDLDTAVAEHSIWIIYVDQFPDLEPLRRDPRYAALRERLGLPTKSLVKP